MPPPPLHHPNKQPEVKTLLQWTCDPLADLLSGSKFEQMLSHSRSVRKGDVDDKLSILNMCNLSEDLLDK